MCTGNKYISPVCTWKFHDSFYVTCNFQLRSRSTRIQLVSIMISYCHGFFWQMNKSKETRGHVLVLNTITKVSVTRSFKSTYVRFALKSSIFQWNVQILKNLNIFTNPLLSEYQPNIYLLRTNSPFDCIQTNTQRVQIMPCKIITFRCKCIDAIHSTMCALNICHIYQCLFMMFNRKPDVCLLDNF